MNSLIAKYCLNVKGVHERIFGLNIMFFCATSIFDDLLVAMREPIFQGLFELKKLQRPKKTCNLGKVETIL